MEHKPSAPKPRPWKSRARKPRLSLKCPICKKSVKDGDPDFPFCSDRCRRIDLGKWASGAYRISSPVQDADEGIDQNSEPEES
jgi:endogenous inhibitor of DNA gyrase (YacG/DUF329 family)